VPTLGLSRNIATEQTHKSCYKQRYTAASQFLVSYHHKLFHALTVLVTATQT